MLNPHIFRQYDIRGVVGPDVTVEAAEQIGRAFASLARRRLGKERPTLALGRDNRLTSDDLADGVRRGMTAAGAHVIDVGLVPTPVHSFAVYHGKTDGGLQVTGVAQPAAVQRLQDDAAAAPSTATPSRRLRRMIEESDYESGEGASRTAR
jgi:phosphomannomutase